MNKEDLKKLSNEEVINLFSNRFSELRNFYLDEVLRDCVHEIVARNLNVSEVSFKFGSNVFDKITAIRYFIGNFDLDITENNFEFISKFIVKNAEMIRNNDTSNLINNYILTMKDKKFVESLCFQPNIDLCELLLMKYNFDEGFYRKIISENVLCDDNLIQVVAEKISTNMSAFY